MLPLQLRELSDMKPFRYWDYPDVLVGRMSGQELVCPPESGLHRLREWRLGCKPECSQSSALHMHEVGKTNETGRQIAAAGWGMNTGSALSVFIRAGRSGSTGP